MKKIVLILLFTALCCARDQNPSNDLSERISNFSFEVLYHASKSQDGQNFILSPFTIWNVLAIIAEGAAGRTADEIYNAIKWSRTNQRLNTFKDISQRLTVNTDTVELKKINAMFVNEKSLPLMNYLATAREQYDTEVISLDFSNSVLLANVINKVTSNFTHGLIKKIVEPDYFQNTNMVVASAIYFKGQWSVPFKTSSTSLRPFHDSEGQEIGHVNMMYQRFAFPLTNFREIKAKVLELPYGTENRMSMFIMLPNPGVSIEQMLLHLNDIKFDTFLEEMRISKEEFPEDEVDCFIPRFEVNSELELKSMLKNFGIEALFDPSKASLPGIAKTPLHVSNIFHKAHIEVTEKGTTAAAVTVAELRNRNGIVPFNVNKPFAYIIVDKFTKTIVLGGFYKQPVLY